MANGDAEPSFYQLDAHHEWNDRSLDPGTRLEFLRWPQLECARTEPKSLVMLMAGTSMLGVIGHRRQSRGSRHESRSLAIMAQPNRRLYRSNTSSQTFSAAASE
jgi:hypothetical protein